MNEQVLTVNFLCKDKDETVRVMKLVKEFFDFSGVTPLTTEIRFPTEEERALGKFFETFEKKE